MNLFNYIWQLLLSVFLAQSLVGAIGVYFKQLQNPNIDYWTSVKLFVSANVGRYVIVAIATIVACYIMSDYLNLSMSRRELAATGLKNLSKIEKVQYYFRSYTTGFGAFIELIAILLYKKGFAKIMDYDKKEEPKP